MSKQKKLRNRLARQVIDGEVTRAEALARLGLHAARKSAAPSLAKAESARSAWPGQPPVPRYPGDEEYLRAAFRPIARPAIAKAAAPAARGNPAQILKAMRELTAVTAPPPVQPARSRTPAELAMLREAENISDPESRERFRSGLMARLEGTA